MELGEIIGWVGNISLAICGIPQAIKCHRNGHAKGIDPYFLWMWYIGEWMACFYHNYTSDRVPQNINYTVNLIAISIIVYYKYYQREETDGRIKEEDSSIKEESFQQRVLCRIRSKRRRRIKVRSSKNDEGRTE